LTDKILRYIWFLFFLVIFFISRQTPTPTEARKLYRQENVICAQNQTRKDVDMFAICSDALARSVTPVAYEVASSIVKWIFVLLWCDLCGVSDGMSPNRRRIWISQRRQTAVGLQNQHRSSTQIPPEDSFPVVDFLVFWSSLHVSLCYHLFFSNHPGSVRSKEAVVCQFMTSKFWLRYTGWVRKK